MIIKGKFINRRDFLEKCTSFLIAGGALVTGCKKGNQYQGKDKSIDEQFMDGNSPDTDPSAWWQKGEFIVHDTVDTTALNKGLIRARVNGRWREFKVAKLPKRFIQWSMKTRIERLERMIRVGGMDPRDLAGSHNACVATYGGPSRDSAVSLNTAYKGMGFPVQENKLAERVEKIREEGKRIERDERNPFKMLQAKAEFLTKSYEDTSDLDPTKQVSLELFTTPDFYTHTFLNMMANPIVSASFLAFPTFEIRAIPQLLHPQNPHLTKAEKNLIAYTNSIHDFIHSGLGDRITCIYHIIELFDDTPNDSCKGKRVI